MKLKGQIVDKLREAMGGKTPTERRIEKLVEELAALRGQRVETIQSGLVTPAEIPDVGSGVVAVDVSTPPAEHFLPPGPEEEEEDDGPEAAPAAEVTQSERQVMMAAIKNLEAKVSELSKLRTAEDKEEAIGAGRLPIVVTPAAPLGYTGSAQLPRGVWFETPAAFRQAPKILMMICGCPDCTPFRLQHYFCAMCHKGPFDYQQKNPAGRKIWLAPGSTWGIPHESCSVVCYMRYMELMGVVTGVNEHQPLGQPAGDGPAKPALLPGSD